MLKPDEIVYQIDMSQSDKNIQAQYEANRLAKLRHAERREQERFDAPSPILDMISKIQFALKKTFQKKR